MKNNESYYSLVIAVAKRAREITSDAFDNKLVLDEKPVKTAVDELYNGEYKIIEDQASENNRGFLWGRCTAVRGVFIVAKVAISRASYSFDALYSYSVPEELAQKVKSGVRVLVPLAEETAKP